MSDDLIPVTGRTMRMPRSRGAVSGVLLVLLGAWAALAPFIGPYFRFSYTPHPSTAWHWTAARGWFEVLPGGLAVFGGLLLLASSHRLVTSLGAWLAALGGGWLVVGPTSSIILRLGSIGRPGAATDRRYVAEMLAFFSGVGALIILVAAVAIGRLSARTVRDLRAAAEREQAAALEREDAEQQEPAPGEGASAWQPEGGAYPENPPSFEASRSYDADGLPVAAGAGTGIAAAGTYAGYREWAARDEGRATTTPESGAAATTQQLPVAEPPADPEPAAETEPKTETETETEPVAESSEPESARTRQLPVADTATAAEPVAETAAETAAASEAIAEHPAERFSGQEPATEPESVTTQQLPVAEPEPATEPAAKSEQSAEQSAEQSGEPESVTTQQLPAAAPAPAAVHEPLVLEPPEGFGPTSASAWHHHPTGQAQTWNPDDQRPTDTGDLPRVARREPEQPRRYVRAADAAVAKPADATPGTTEPGTTEPGTTEPGTTEPGTTEPGTTEPGTTELETTGPSEQPEPASDRAPEAAIPDPVRQDEELGHDLHFADNFDDNVGDEAVDDRDGEPSRHAR